MQKHPLLNKYRPVTPGTRGLIRLKKKHLWKGNPEKSLCVRVKNTGGRNNVGRKTITGRGGGYKKIYRKIDFHRFKDNSVEAYVKRIEYDPNRTANIALLQDGNNNYSYIVAPEGISEGQKIHAGDNNVDILVGNCTYLENIPLGSNIYNIELTPGKGAQIVRSAGVTAKLVGREDGYSVVELPSKELRKFSGKCKATIGTISNAIRSKIRLSKAGDKRRLGKVPRVRGVAKNPVDHPNGGDTSGGKKFTNFTGRVVKGKKTRKKNKLSDRYISSKRKSKKKG
ncbi:50S ribosomal protein L2 [Rickettsiales bacterium (ex Bugula neritina AB1)]|nr:50S ribosomal protein L2 [Rickettsiales bacterium (ex Bugula neritina AB1)]